MGKLKILGSGSTGHVFPAPSVRITIVCLWQGTQPGGKAQALCPCRGDPTLYSHLHTNTLCTAPAIVMHFACEP